MRSLVACNSKSFLIISIVDGRTEYNTAQDSFLSRLLRLHSAASHAANRNDPRNHTKQHELVSCASGFRVSSCDFVDGFFWRNFAQKQKLNLCPQITPMFKMNRRNLRISCKPVNDLEPAVEYSAH